MVTDRRIYILLVSETSLLALTWALIALGRDLLPFGGSAARDALADHQRFVLLAIPFSLVHGLWAHRLVLRDEGELGNELRRMILYGLLAILLLAFATQAFNFLSAYLRSAFGVEPLYWPGNPRPVKNPPSDARMMADSLIGMLVLGVFWIYHEWIVIQDERVLPETGYSAAPRRLYVLTLGAVGMALAATGSIQMLQQVMLQIWPALVIGRPDRILQANAIAQTLVGLALWVAFWLQAQCLYLGPNDEERESKLRGFYLYLVIFVAVLSSVAGVTSLLAEFLRQRFGLDPGNDWRGSVALLLVAAVIWAYHYWVLRHDTARAAESPRQAGARRLYAYLVAGIGLAAFLGGAIGIGRTSIQLLAGDTFGSGLKEQLAWVTAALVAGLPVWLIPWRRLQKNAEEMRPAGRAER